MTKTKVNITAIHCPTPEAFRSVYDKLDKAGYKKQGSPLYNVWTHTQDFERGMRYVMVYENSNEVKLAAKVDRRDFHIKVIEYDKAIQP